MTPYPIFGSKFPRLLTLHLWHECSFLPRSPRLEIGFLADIPTPYFSPLCICLLFPEISIPIQLSFRSNFKLMENTRSETRGERVSQWKGGVLGEVCPGEWRNIVGNQGKEQNWGKVAKVGAEQFSERKERYQSKLFHSFIHSTLSLSLTWSFFFKFPSLSPSLFATFEAGNRKKDPFLW